MAYYEKPKPSERRQQAREARGKRVLAAFVILIVLIGGWYVYEVASTIKTHEETLCPIGQANLFGKGGVNVIPEQHIILIDATDPYTEIQERAVLRYMEDIKQNLPVHARLAIYTIQSESRKTTPEISLCNPGDGRHLHPITGNPKLAAQKWRESFADKIDRIVKKATQARGDTSPILEYIQAISVDGFTRTTKTRTLHIISDMRQHTPRYSHYRNGINYQYFTSNRLNEYYLAKDLYDVEIVIHDIQRRDKIAVNRRGLIRFWEQYFKEMGGHIKRVKPIAGAS